VLTALVAAALAVLAWPTDAARRRDRLRMLVPRRWPMRPLPSFDGSRWLPAASAAAGTALGALLGTPLVAALAGMLAGLAARAWLRHTREGDESERLLALGRGLAALAADLRSGRSLDAATHAAAACCGDDRTGQQLLRAVRAADVGGLSDEPFSRISAAVLLSARTGCSLAEVIGAVEDDLRARHRHELELRAATAGPRAGALLLAGLPVLGLAMGSGVGADPWRVLTTTGTGQVLLVAGVALEIAGVAWSGRLVRRALR
jgi:tight adherence protein B